MTATFWRPLTSRLFFVTDNTPQKRKDHQPSVVRTILLPSSETPEQMTEMLRMVRDITGITRSDLDTASRTITLRASPQAIAVASDLIGNLEQPTGEVVLEMESSRGGPQSCAAARNYAAPNGKDFFDQLAANQEA